MNREEFNAALNRHSLSKKEFARMIGVSYRTVKRFGGEYACVPRYVAIIISLMDQKREAVTRLSRISRQRIYAAGTG